MKRLHATYDGKCLILQRDEYIESGWYITHNSGSDTWNLYEIPEGGGSANRIGSYPNLDEAILNTQDLT